MCVSIWKHDVSNWLLKNLLRTVRVEVDSINGSCHLIEADIVETLKARAIDLPNAVIWYQELLLPPHEHVLAVGAILVVEVGLLCLFCQGPPGRETCPMLHVFFVAGAPVIVTCLKRILRPNDFAFEERCKGRVFGSKAFDGLAGETQ
jgi:hypothetical protein